MVHITLETMLEDLHILMATAAETPLAMINKNRGSCYDAAPCGNEEVDCVASPSGGC